MITVDQGGEVLEVTSPSTTISITDDAAAVEIVTMSTVVVESPVTEVVTIQEPATIISVTPPPASTVTVFETPPSEIVIKEGRGPAGLGGDDGTDGTDGVDGDPGLSAYEIALTEGFVGTEAQWLASLVGPAGAPGVSVGSDLPVIYEQPNPSAMWHIVHGRGSNPSVVLVRDDGVRIGGFGVVYPDHNTVDIYPGLIAGEATLTF